MEIDSSGRLTIKNGDPLEILMHLANNIEKVDFYPETKKQGRVEKGQKMNQFQVGQVGQSNSR